MPGRLEALAATAAATTVAAATAATAAVSTAATAAAATATGTVFAGLGLVDGEGSAVEVLAVQGRDRGLRLGVAAHLDERETLAPTGVPVLNDLGGLHGAVLPTQLLEVRARGVIAEISDVQLAAHVIAPNASWAC